MARRDQRSAEAEGWRKLYKTARWRTLRLAQLSREPLCAMCQSRGIVKAAEVVDHRRPHKGSLDLFFDPSNVWSLCRTPCHDSIKQSWEKNDTVAIGADGWPVL